MSALADTLAAMLVAPRVIFDGVLGGQPPSKARPRFGGNGAVYSSTKQRRAETALRNLLRENVAVPSTGMVAVAVAFYRESRHRVDIDNMVKHLFDAANRVVFGDDSQITCLLATAHMDRERPRTEVTFFEHDSDHRRPVPTRETACEKCGATVVSKNARARRFCSRECSRTGTKRDRGMFCCSVCGTEAARGRGTGKTQRFCSDVCRLTSLHGSNRKPRGPNKSRPGLPMGTCSGCGKALSRPEYTSCRICWLTRKTRPSASRGAMDVMDDARELIRSHAPLARKG